MSNKKLEFFCSADLYSSKCMTRHVVVSVISSHQSCRLDLYLVLDHGGSVAGWILSLATRISDCGVKRQSHIDALP